MEFKIQITTVKAFVIKQQRPDIQDEYVSNSWSQKSLTWFSPSLSFSSSFLFHLCLYRCLFIWKSNTLTYVHISMSERNMDLLFTPFLSEQDFFFLPFFFLLAKVFMLWIGAFIAIFIFLMSVSQSVTNLFAYIHTFFASISFLLFALFSSFALRTW